MTTYSPILVEREIAFLLDLDIPIFMVLIEPGLYAVEVCGQEPINDRWVPQVRFKVC
jgi:hypothetical protein